MTPMSMYIGEFVGTALLLLLGNGINMTCSLKKSYGKGGGWIVICLGWGLAVSMAVYLVGWVSGAHLNPAVTLALALSGRMAWSLVPGYWIAQFLGAFVGACLAYLVYRDMMNEEDNPAVTLGVFSTGPAIDNAPWNVVTEVIGTFILIVGILAIGYGGKLDTVGLTPFIVGLLICVIGMGTGGATGFAINPARDLGPRIAHAVLPIKGKGGSNWGYAWVPIVGPLVGGALGVWFFDAFIKIVNG